MNDEKPPVLLIDDKEENLFSLKSILSDSNCHVLTALSGRKGLSLLKSNNVACILLDVHMPEMDGFEVAANVKKNPRTKHIPIIFVTAIEISIEKVKQGYDSGALDYLIKPLSPNLVRSKVELYCQLYQSNKKVNFLLDEQKNNKG